MLDESRDSRQFMKEIETQYDRKRIEKSNVFFIALLTVFFFCFFFKFKFKFFFNVLTIKRRSKRVYTTILYIRDAYFMQVTQVETAVPR